jgi:oxygen-dependent protoporphyrinogen oxidase
LASADIVVVGAGISGLATAFGLHRRGHPVRIVEAAACAGGVIGTRRRDGALFERGPNSTLDTTPLIGELLRNLGIADERVAASAVASVRYVVRGGRPVALPTSPGAFLATRAFTAKAKLRLLREPFIARTRPGVEESIATFVRRRLGTEFLDYAIDPFVAGIYAGDPERISVPAAFPRLHALEQQYGSLIRGQVLGARARRKNREVAKNTAGSFSFRGGMQALTDALVRALPPIEYGVAVRRIVREGDGGLVLEATHGGDALTLRARAVVVAVPAGAAAPMLAVLAPEASRAIAGIESAPIAVVASTWRRSDVAHSLAGFGFLVPKREQRRILGCLFSSSMFEGRAPEGTVLLTTFAGGRRDPAVAELTDPAVADLVRGELTDLLGARGAPLWQEVVRWPQAIPQYDLGHLDRIRQVDAAEAAVPGLYVCASYRDGVAVGDRIKSAHAIAARVSAWAGGNPAAKEAHAGEATGKP